MIKFFNILIILIRIFVIIKITILLYNTRNGFNDSTMESSIWWLLFLVFDIWFELMIPIDRKENN